MGERQIANVAGVHGLAASFGVQSEPFQSGETSTTIARGDLVSITTAKKILQSTTTVAPELCIGIAQEDILPGEIGMVAIGGVALACKAEGAIAAGALVRRSASTAGAVASFTPAAATEIGDQVGVAAAAAAGNLVDLFIK